jgi:hypothetical protein
MNPNAAAPGGMNPVGGNIQIATQPRAGLHLGDIVTLHVIKQLEGAKWAVGIGGRVYAAFSAVPLEAGAVLRARVGAAGGKLILTISDVVPDAVRAAVQQQGLPAGGEAEFVARALARSGLPILAETIHKVRTLLSQTGVEPRRGARAAATLVDKGIDPSTPGARALLPVLAFGEKGGGDPRRYRGRPLPDTPRKVREFVSGLASEPAAHDAALQAYNHVRGKTQSWVVIPFVFTEGNQRVNGTVKILYDPFHERPQALTLSTDRISFHVALRGAAEKRAAGRLGRLTLYADDEGTRRAAARVLDSMRSKFNNMGLEVDDIVNDGGEFDGYSPVEEGLTLPSVDTVG